MFGGQIPNEESSIIAGRYDFYETQEEIPVKKRAMITVDTTLAGDIERMLSAAAGRTSSPIGLPANKGGASSSLDHSCVVHSESCGFHDRYAPPERQDDSIFAVYVVSNGDAMWTYGRLFHDHGKPVMGTFTDPGNKFLGIYYLKNNETGVEYEIDVVTSMRLEYLDKNCPKCGNVVSVYALNGSLCPNCRHMFLQANYGN